MARGHRSLGGFVVLLLVGCTRDTSLELSRPFAITPGGPGVSFASASSGRSAPWAEGALNAVGNDPSPTPVQTGPVLRTAVPQVASPFNFGPTPVGTVQQVTWTVTNVGDAATGTLGINSSNGVDFDASATFCPSLLPLEDCTVTITYVPQSLGPHSSTFSFTGFPLTYTFVGEGRPPFGVDAP